MIRLIVCIVLFLLSNGLFAQELRVKSLAPVPTDLTARKQPRQDLNGRQCALLKVMVMDDITDCGNANIGGIEAKGVMKLVYVPSVAKSITLNFKYHYPLTIVFADYGVARLDGGATYELRIVDALQIMVDGGKVDNGANGANGVGEQSTGQGFGNTAEEGNQQPLESHRDNLDTSSPHGVPGGNKENTGNAVENWRKLFLEAEKSQDYKKAFAICKKAAEAGNAEAQCNLGYCYAKGRGCKADPKEAFYWYKKAVDNGDGMAAWSLGTYYESGDGITLKDDQAAFKYYKLSAEYGCRYGMASLAHCYDYGIGVAADRRKAVDIYKNLSDDKAYEFSATSAFLVGMHYYLCDEYGMGKGWKPDYAEAMKWFRKSAEQNLPEAMGMIGECYKEGYGVEKNWEEAIRWYRKAADFGDTESMWNLGMCYENGAMVEKSVDNAIYWYKKGASTDGSYSSLCKDALKRLGY